MTLRLWEQGTATAAAEEALPFIKHPPGPVCDWRAADCNQCFAGHSQLPNALKELVSHLGITGSATTQTQQKVDKRSQEERASKRAQADDAKNRRSVVGAGS